MYFKQGKANYYAVREANILHVNAALTLINTIESDSINSLFCYSFGSVGKREELLPIDESEFYCALDLVIDNLGLPIKR